MKKNYMRYIALLSALTLTLNTAVVNVQAEGEYEMPTEVAVDSVEDKEETAEVASNEVESETEQAIITGFANFDAEEYYEHILDKRKPEEKDLISRFPETLEVYLNGASKPEEIEVSWFCVGDEYDEEVYYYQFSPKWDEEQYVLDGKINLLTDAPYIGVFVDASETNDGISSRAAGLYNATYETNIFEYLVGSLGFSRAAACGVMANIYSESGFIPTNLQDSFERSLGYTDASYTAAVDNGTYSGFSSDSAGYGLCQWSYSSRKANLLNYKKSKGTSIGDYKMQLEFMKNEFSSYSTVKSAVASAANNADGAYDVAYKYCYYYEAPASKATKSVTRGNLARDKFWPYYKDYVITSAPVTIVKPEETTPEETTPAETTPEETTPAETIPEETTPEETLPVKNGIEKDSNGNLVAYKDDAVDTNINGFVKFEESWWYFESGKTSGKINGLVEGTVNGQTGLWYCKANKVDLSYTGLGSYKDKLYYCKNGKFDASFNDLCYYNGSYWYCKNGIVDITYNSLAYYNGSWWYCKDGKVDWSYTNGLCYYNGSYWYIVNGRVDFSYNSLAYYNGSWWYCKNGKVDWSYTNGLCYYNGSYWYIVNGRVDFSYNSLAYYNGSWWYCKNGKVDWSYTNGLCYYNGSYWYIVNGKVDFSYNSLAYYNGSWWYCKGGKVDWSYTGLCKYNGGWYYCKSGKVDFSYNGFCLYNGSWWYCKSGKVDYSFTGIYQGTVNGTSAQWYVSGGKVNTSYSGTVTYNGKSYNVVNGKVAVSYSTVYASYTTTYKESQTNRTTNLKLACKAINGTIIPNGGTFSFNGIVGARTAAKGYKEAIIYEGGQETGGIGGGICQVATTIFNAALKANFKIVERHQHSLTVHYVPLGYDAAIAWGAKNLRWTNNSGTPIKVEATCASGKLSIRFLADKPVTPPAVTTKVTLSNRVYTLKRYVNGVCNYTTTSKYADK